MRLAGHADAALMVLDRTGHLHVVTESTARMLECTVADLTGTALAARCATPCGADRALRALNAMSGDGPQTLELTLRSGSARVMHVTLRGELVGVAGGTRLLVATATLTRVEPVIPTTSTVHMEISTRPDTFGVIRHLWRDDGAAARLEPGLRCHEWMAQNGLPCTGECHVLALHPAVPAVTTVRNGTMGETALFSARLTGDGVATISVQPLPPAVLDELAHAKKNRLLAKAGLSAREREVLELLLLGRSHEDIAEVTGIGVRTVKFHQGRLLAKLGAESRYDLMRLLL